MLQAVFLRRYRQIFHGSNEFPTVEWLPTSTAQQKASNGLSSCGLETFACKTGTKLREPTERKTGPHFVRPTLHYISDCRLIRNPMFTKPKRLQFVQEAAAQILDSPMPSGCAVTICAGRGGLACAGSVWRHALQVSDNRDVEGERLPVSRGHDEASRIDDL